MLILFYTYVQPTTFLICRLHCSHIHTPSINSNLLIFAYSSHSLCYYSTNVWPTKRPFATFWTLNSHSAHWKLSCQLALLDDISHSSPVAQCCSYYCCSSNELNPHELTQFGHDLSDAHARNSSTTCKGPSPFPLQSLPTPLASWYFSNLPDKKRLAKNMRQITANFSM